MGFFIRSICYFFGILFIVNFFIYYYAFKPAIFENYLNNKDKYDKYNLFLLSDSHGMCLGDIPSENQIFNFSNTSENYLDMYLKIQYLTSVLTRDDTIVISVDNHNLSGYRSGKGRIDENIIYGNTFTQIPTKYLPFDKEFRRFLSKIPMAYPIYNKLIVSYLKSRFDPNGCVELRDFSKFSYSQKKAACYERYKSQFYNRKLAIDQRRYLGLIISLCKEKGVTLVGVKFPLTKELLSIIEYKDFGITEYCKHRGLEIVDLQKIYIKNGAYFFDQDHLNSKGAMAFCKQLKHSLRRKTE